MNKNNIKSNNSFFIMKLKKSIFNLNIKSIAFRFILFLSFCFDLQSGYSQAASPFDGMAFQSYLVDANGAAISGNKSLKFRIWDADTSGNLKWGETQTVTVSSGNFSVILGEGTWDTSAGSARVSLKDLFDGSERYIEITVDGTALAPRLRMLPSPYTFRAKNAETLTDSNGDSTLSLNSGKFTMAKPLDVSGALTATGKVTSGGVDSWDNITVGNQITLEAARGYAYVKDLYASGSIDLGNHMLMKGTHPTLVFSDTNQRSYFLHTNSERLYFLQGNANAKYGEWNQNRPLTIFNGNAVGINNISPSHALDVSGNARVTGSLFLNGQQGLTKVGGNYGTVRTTGGGNGGWEGYSIDNRYVFMSADNSACGLYNDIDNKWIFHYNRDSGGNKGAIHLYCRDAVVGRFQHTNGSRYASYDGDGNWDFYSDRRLKENISKTENLLDRIMKLDVKSFDYKGEDKKENQEIGFIAQEVEPHFPSLISESEDERYDYKVKAIGYSTFGVIATGAVKELKLEKDSEIASLKEENNKLREELESLKMEMNDRLDLFEKTLSKITGGK